MTSLRTEVKGNGSVGMMICQVFMRVKTAAKSLKTHLHGPVDPGKARPTLRFSPFTFHFLPLTTSRALRCLN